MKKRIVSAVIALVILIPLIVAGGILFDIGISLISFLALTEILTLFDKKIPLPVKVILYLSVLAIIFYNDIFNKANLVNILSFITIINFLTIIFYDKKDYNFFDAISLYGVIIFIGFIFNIFKEIRNNDIYVFVYLVLVPTLTDTFAYFSGRIFGKHKLCEKISPNKTIEGAIGGLIISTIISSIFYLYEINQSGEIINIIILTGILSILGQLGDLFFSSIKRCKNIKDFSNIMPGHGGILDRLDSIIFVFLTYEFIIYFI